MKCRRFRVGPIVVAVCLLWPAQASQAQPFPESSRQKAQEERKKADEKANDEDYKALMKRLPSSDKRADPWGGMRAPSTNHDK
jgi:hypothetical protein